VDIVGRWFLSVDIVGRWCRIFFNSSQGCIEKYTSPPWGREYRPVPIRENVGKGGREQRVQ
jgi:hypothetical protein